jgi:DinB superfamily
MKRILVTIAVALLLVPAVGNAQGMGSTAAAAGPFADALSRLWQTAARNMPAAADDMPAEKYGFKPTPEQMSFGHIIAHETQSNETLCGDLSGHPAMAAAPDSTAPKDHLVARIKQSFAACQEVVRSLKEAELGDSVPFFGGRKATKAVVAGYLIHDWADHYAQAAMYLRLNGILPPSARHRM